MFIREQVKGQLDQRISACVPLRQNLAWLRSTQASVADAVELLEGVGLHRIEARFLLSSDPAWKALLEGETR